MSVTTTNDPATVNQENVSATLTFAVPAATVFAVPADPTAACPVKEGGSLMHLSSGCGHVTKVVGTSIRRTACGTLLFCRFLRRTTSRTVPVRRSSWRGATTHGGSLCTGARG
ncbi:hypothetical protein F8566_33380 [Actinomadura rudentiformis]|uniref:Uncharacterized protein n=1 Tax=Actinomadura rudentiformis TaxID=359158 RepID=A0A6H9YKW5_9ACTN|nr:hypothetical protein F8566_33380 [Actinomadura rudentiformis]